MQRNMLQRWTVMKMYKLSFVAKSDPYQLDRGDKIGNNILPDGIVGSLVQFFIKYYLLMCANYRAAVLARTRAEKLAGCRWATLSVVVSW